MKLVKIFEKKYKRFVYAVSDEPVSPVEAETWCENQRGFLAFFDDEYYEEDFSRNIRHEWPDKSNEFWHVKGIKSDGKWHHAGLQPSADKELLIFGDHSYRNFICTGHFENSMDISTESSVIASFKNKQFNMLSKPVEFDDAKYACYRQGLPVALFEKAEEIKEVSKYIRDNFSDRSYGLWHVHGVKNTKIEVDDKLNKVYERNIEYVSPFVLDPFSEKLFRNSNGSIKTPFVICRNRKATNELEPIKSEDFYQINITKPEPFLTEGLPKVNSDVLSDKVDAFQSENNFLNVNRHFNLFMLFICIASFLVVLAIALSRFCKKYKKVKANNTTYARKAV